MRSCYYMNNMNVNTEETESYDSDVCPSAKYRVGK